jgi:hypothetical protein
MAVYTIPTRPGWSRVMHCSMINLKSPRMSSPLVQAVVKATNSVPFWAHIHERHSTLDGDTYFLHLVVGGGAACWGLGMGCGIEAGAALGCGQIWLWICLQLPCHAREAADEWRDEWHDLHPLLHALAGVAAHSMASLCIAATPHQTFRCSRQSEHRVPV